MECRTITVFSSKGGVGKTFVTVNLATTLALAKNKVLLIDLDLQAGQDMARMLNMSVRNSIVDVLPHLDNDDPEFLTKQTSVHDSTVHFIPAGRNAQQAAHLTRDNLRIFLKEAEKHYDYVIIDAGTFFNEPLISALDMSNLILLVATPDILAVYQIKWALQVLKNLHFPLQMIKLVLNRSESRGSVAWQEVRRALPVEIFGHVPSDGKTVGLALNRGIPCVMSAPRAGVSESFIKMASALRKDESFVKASDVEKQRSLEGIGQTGQFWEKFGISQQAGAATAEESYSSAEQEIVALKRRIHEKLVERLNLDGITPESFSDTASVMAVKENAQNVVTSILIEESGGKLASQEERAMIVKDIVNEALGLGPLEDFLADPDVTDIMVNNKDEIYIEKKGKLVRTNKKFVSNDKMRSIIDRIIAPLGRRIDESTPMVDARLPDGSRINAIIPPLSLAGPMITIRKFGKERVEITDLLEKYHSLTEDMALFLKACVHSRKNIIVSGGTGSGKTTLLNVISEFIPDDERIITIEDAAELRLKKSHWGRLESRPSNVEGKGQVTIRDLFINCLRMRPDRIVIGECRGPEVLDMLQAMNTGHDGSMTTLHANSTRDVLTRMHSMILLSGIELPVRAINEMISSAIDVIVHVNRFSDGSRKITGISETIGLDDDFLLQLKDVFVFKQEGMDESGRILGQFQATGYVPRLYKDFVTQGIKIDQDMFNASA